MKTRQGILGEALGEAVSLAFRVDDAYFANVQRDVAATANGTKFQLKYRPSTDINGNYGVNVEYGLMAGLDPNRALVFALQARGDKLISRGFTRRNLPITLNAAEEERAVDMEEMRDSLKAGVASLAAAIPQMASQGQDPTKIVRSLSTVITERRKGTPIEDAVAKAFEPEKPKPQPAEPAGIGMEPGPGEPPQVEQGPVDNEAMPAPPPMQRLLAGLTGTGRPVMSQMVSRSVPA